MGKERFECFTGRACGTLLDYRDAEFFQQQREERFGRHPQDKGQGALLDSFIRCLTANQPPPATAENILESSLLTLAAQQSLLERRPVALQELRKLLA